MSRSLAGTFDLLAPWLRVGHSDVFGFGTVVSVWGIYHYTSSWQLESSGNMRFHGISCLPRYLICERFPWSVDVKSPVMFSRLSDHQRAALGELCQAPSLGGEACPLAKATATLRKCIYFASLA